MAMHFRHQLQAIFLLVFVVFHASSCEQEDYWKTKLPKVDMPQAIKDSLLHSHASETFTKEKKASVNQPYTVFSWKYDADNAKDQKLAESTEPLSATNAATVSKAGHVKQPYTVFSWKYDANNNKEKASVKQPYTVFSWKYDADNNKEKTMEVVAEPTIIDTSDKQKASVKQPYTVFSWKYDADNNKEKTMEVVAEPTIIDTSDKQKASVNQPYTVFSWKYDADNNKDKAIDEVVQPTIIDTSNKQKASVKQPYTVFSWKYDADNNKEKKKEVVEKAQIDQPYTVFSWRYNSEEDSPKTSIKKRSHHHHLLHKNENSKDAQAAQEDEDLSGGSVFFVEKSLRLGMTLKHDFQKTPKVPFLPKHIVQSIPFSVDKYTEILNLLSVKPESEEATAIKQTLGVCLERPKVEKENRTCAQSIEDVVDFVVRELGSNDVDLRMMRNDIEVPNGIQDYVITKVKKLAVPANTAAACHRMSYPYVVYYCHHQRDIGHYDVTLVSPTSGTTFQTTAVCHYDTYAWQPNVLALRYLRIRPGDAPVCHFSAINDMFWSLKANSMSLDMAQ